MRLRKGATAREALAIAVKYWVDVMDKDTEAIEMESLAQKRQAEIDRFIESYGGERHRDSMIANEFGLH